MRNLWMLSLLVATAACSTSSNSVTTDSSGTDDGAEDGTDDAVGKKKSSSKGSDAGSSKEGSTEAKVLYPLAKGYEWTYKVASVGGGAACDAGTHSAKVVKESTVDGKSVFDITSFCTAVSTPPQFAAGEGDEVLQYYGGKWLSTVHTPLKEGETWTYYNTSYTWKKAGRVKVPAGTFSDCWTAEQNVSYTAYQTYCRGVGLVRSYSSDLNGNGWDAQLLKKNF